MTKNNLERITDRAVEQTHDALQMIFDELNKGQKQKLLKKDEIKKLVERYDVKTE